MSYFSQFTGGKPQQVTVYDSGTGTYTPSAANAWCYVTLVGGGGGGSNCWSGGGGFGGRAGATLQRWVKLAGATSYAIGAGGAAGTPGAVGGSTTLGTLTAVGGQGGGFGPPQGATPNNGWAGIPAGESNFFGSAGGNSGQGGTSATGYGSGGAGAIQNWTSGSQNFGGSGTAGSGGLIIIEDFGP
jgi:hypothetical protein